MQSVIYIRFSNIDTVYNRGTIFYIISLILYLMAILIAFNERIDIRYIILYIY